jgi:hypothetical protein
MDSIWQHFFRICGQPYSIHDYNQKDTPKCEYGIILEECTEAIIKTKKEIEEFIVKNQNEKVFLENLTLCWEEEL